MVTVLNTGEKKNNYGFLPNMECWERREGFLAGVSEGKRGGKREVRDEKEKN